MFRKLAFIPLLAMVACSGEPKQEALPEGLENALKGQTPEQVVELANAVALDFINLVNDDMELNAIITPWDRYKPKSQCFDYWHSMGEFIPTPDVINSCELWAKELAWLYGTYGYEVAPLAFKSDLYWNHIESYLDSPRRKEERRLSKAKEGPNTSCPKAAQTGYRTPELLPFLSKKDTSCPDIATEK